MQTVFIWCGIVFCLTQSAIFSGLNLAYFSLSRLRLEVEAYSGNRRAAKVLALRQEPNLLLCTILWGNVGINVLLTLLSESVMTGVASFAFSTFVITIVGEILPQAYFSRQALLIGATLVPVIRFYQVVLYPLAKPASMMLDRLVGRENIEYFKENKIRHLLKMHIDSTDADIDEIEGMGAMNFLTLDDIEVCQEGEPIQIQSIIGLRFENGRPIFPSDVATFVEQVNSSGEKWVVLTDSQDRPRLLLDADGYLRNVMKGGVVSPADYCHLPILVHNDHIRLGEVLNRLEVHPVSPEDDVIDADTILVWTARHRRIITGADIFGRLMRGISRVRRSGRPSAT
ncbi:DUF21 domain-containing protein [Pseudodesulfovibrio piezophilus]|uniref:CBS domain protein (Hemolysins and related protein family) n=1 Tax=Pseudodesulfovibrio piezophilus (strain DSM 21447 / JCM 15486 / C1TLV30) TaxID=1322246 RepID=M1WTV8_PSEP2|nr:DUF21 domain-containing protein [Pseudodesulfovibrio piezophilus]CCH49937.1 CBS domain protein (Hemolysins and related protein family) [Pseudodesulfovibrio piezophilus C1TLV30]